jgi:hypothetical protein
MLVFGWDGGGLSWRFLCCFGCWVGCCCGFVVSVESVCRTSCV